MRQAEIEKLSYTAQRMLALCEGKENKDDFGTELQTYTIYNVSRDLIIGCNENNIDWWLKNTNDDKEIRRKQQLVKSD